MSGEGEIYLMYVFPIRGELAGCVTRKDNVLYWGVNTGREVRDPGILPGIPDIREFKEPLLISSSDSVFTQGSNYVVGSTKHSDDSRLLSVDSSKPEYKYARFYLALVGSGDPNMSRLQRFFDLLLRLMYCYGRVEKEPMARCLDERGAMQAIETELKASCEFYGIRYDTKNLPGMAAELLAKIKR